MRFVLFVLSVIAATTVLDTPTKAQNYPWCAIYSGGRGGGGTNCGFTTLNNAWQPRAGLVASANPIRNTCLHPDHIGTLGIGAIHIEGLTLTMLGKQTMKSLLFIVAFAIGLLAFLVATQPVSAARGWWSWPNSGYCPSGTCNKLGGWRASNVKNCSAANCRGFYPR